MKELEQKEKTFTVHSKLLRVSKEDSLWIDTKVCCVNNNENSFEEKKGQLVTVTPKELENDARKVTFKGGILGDEVGLGNMLTVLALIHAHPMSQDPLEDPLTADGLLKSRATLS